MGLNPVYPLSALAGLAAAGLTGTAAHLVLDRRLGRLRRLAGTPGRAAGGTVHPAKWTFSLYTSLVLALVRPVVDLGKRKQQRQMVAAEAPFLLDLLVICADGGMNLHQSLATASDLIGGPLGDGLAGLRRDLDLGQPLPMALDALSRRLGTDEVNAFVRILKIGHALGTPVAESLRHASGYLRTRLRLATEQRLAAVPLKLTLCTMAFFMPPIFVLLLLPNVLNFAGSRW